MKDKIGVLTEDLADDCIYHIHPVDDLREHVVEKGQNCWCSPTIKYEGDTLIIVHNSLDEREKYETGQRKPH